MKVETKPTLTLLIYQIQDILKENEPEVAVSKLNKLLQDWIDANDLHPEEVETLGNKI